MASETRSICYRPEIFAIIFAVICIFTAGHSQCKANNKAYNIFDGKPKVIVVNGYSTSFQWPRILQRKLNRYFNGKRIIRVKPATKGGTQIAKWINTKTGEPLQPWSNVLRPTLHTSDGIPVIVLAQQSLQWLYGDRRIGIRNADDKVRIQKGTDALEKYVKLLMSVLPHRHYIQQRDQIHL